MTHLWQWYSIPQNFDTTQYFTDSTCSLGMMVCRSVNTAYSLLTAKQVNGSIPELAIASQILTDFRICSHGLSTKEVGGDQKLVFKFVWPAPVLFLSKNNAIASTH